MSSSKGFTLIELAIVLVIVGMLLGVGSGMMGMLTTAIKVREAKDNVDAAVQSITSWASANNRIPDTAAFAAAATTTTDAWGRNLVYLYDANLAASTPTKDTICGRRSTALTLISNDPAATISNVAFALISKSNDATLETTASDAAVTISRAATGTITLDANNSDIVRWVTLDELRTKVGCQGAPLKIVNNELPYGYKSTTYNATIFADGGVQFLTGGNFKWCIKGTLPPGIANPTSGCSATANCSSLGTEGEWLQATTLILPSAPASPTAEGSYNFTVLVRDNNDNSTSTSIDNCASKPFVLTINP